MCCWDKSGYWLNLCHNHLYLMLPAAFSFPHSMGKVKQTSGLSHTHTVYPQTFDDAAKRKIKVSKHFKF
jgi:hypothetical protein